LPAALDGRLFRIDAQAAARLAQASRAGRQPGKAGRADCRCRASTPGPRLAAQIAAEWRIVRLVVATVTQLAAVTATGRVERSDDVTDQAAFRVLPEFGGPIFGRHKFAGLAGSFRSRRTSGVALPDGSRRCGAMRRATARPLAH